ncbi:hypothetical protein MHU86_17125 [Fragilaria crotonensis]|nr:hypothetical protein MHU86_17125 [Fragilaria crotonensis]
MPRITRQQASNRNQVPEPIIKDDVDEDGKSSDEENSDGEEDTNTVTQQVNTFNGIIFATYQDMVDAKRQRNEQRLVDCGLMKAIETVRQAKRSTAIAGATKRGIVSKKRTSETIPLGKRRKSNRIAGIESDGAFVEHESAGVVATSVGHKNSATGVGLVAEPGKTETHFFNERVNDGSDLSVTQAIELSGSKWVSETSVGAAQDFVSHELATFTDSVERKVGSPKSVAEGGITSYLEKLDGVAADDDKCVAKVTPDRVYSITCHPSEDSLIVGIFDVASQTFTEVFATYDDSVKYTDRLGYGLDMDYKFWVQHVSMDGRFNNDKCFFVSTSAGTAMHMDVRVGKGKLTFNENLSEKKINTLSSEAVQKKSMVVAEYSAGRSVNSAFFSPSGSHMVATTQMNTLDMLHDCQHMSEDKFKPATRVKHDNLTGRWLTTFNANWHPHLDVFVVGSMLKPRVIEVFDCHGKKLRDIRGDVLTAVASRCCFHPSTDKVVIVGGNSSGRVTVVR